MQDKAQPIWLIAGPTAAGKSALASWWAEQTGGEIVNADSVQLYRDLPILTGQPGAAERSRAPHHLYGVADAEEVWSVGRWLREVVPRLESIASRGHPAIIVGGTGLYFNALTRGLADAPATPSALRDSLAERMERIGEIAFRAELAAVDPAAEARIATNDRQRLIRALAVHGVTGRPLSDWWAKTHPSLAPGRWRGLIVAPPREAIAELCEHRLHRMVAAGAVREVAALLARGLSPDLPAMKALGVAAFADHLSGACSLARAIERAAAETRRYAKRQSTWFRNQQPDWPRIVAADPEGQRRALLRLTAAD